MVLPAFLQGPASQHDNFVHHIQDRLIRHDDHYLKLNYKKYCTLALESKHCHQYAKYDAQLMKWLELLPL